MTNYDKYGKLLVSTSGKKIEVRQTGSIVTISASHLDFYNATVTKNGTGVSITTSIEVQQSGSVVVPSSSFINFATGSNLNNGSGLFVSSTGAGATVKLGVPTIYALSGFRSSDTLSQRNFYVATSSNFFSGSNIFCFAALVRHNYFGPKAFVCGTTEDFGSNGWSLWCQGEDLSIIDTPGWSSRFYVSGNGQDTPLGADFFDFPPSNKKWALLYYYIDTIADTINGARNGDVTAPITAGGSSFKPSKSSSRFSIGASSTGSIGGNNTIEIAAVAILTASVITNNASIADMFQACYDAHDIVSTSAFQWDHLWSVKQNPPGQEWINSTGNGNLTRSGSMLITTSSNPLWI